MIKIALHIFVPYYSIFILKTIYHQQMRYFNLGKYENDFLCLLSCKKCGCLFLYYKYMFGSGRDLLVLFICCNIFPTSPFYIIKLLGQCFFYFSFWSMFSFLLLMVIFYDLKRKIKFKCI